MNSITLLGVLFLNLASGQDSNFTSVMCHECWPYLDGVNCAELDTNATLTNCTNFGVFDLNVTCFSAFIELPGTSSVNSGVYRGCAMRLIDYTDYCEFYKEYVAPQNISIVSCAECNEDGCNIHRFTEDGQLITDNGQIRQSISAGLMTLIVLWITSVTI